MNRNASDADGENALAFLGQLATATSRRRFLQWSGVTIGIALVGCSSDRITAVPQGVNLGSGDVGVLNYAYALEQLEAAFYTRVLLAPYTGMTMPEREILTDLRDHEIVHREFLRTALGSAAIGSLEFNFGSVDFANRTSVLTTARVFEDLGVGAYNGAGQLLTDAGLLLIAGKIVSVEARHASAIRDLLNPGSADFAGNDIVTVSGALDVALSPAMVLDAGAAFITTAIDARSLPTA